MKKLIIILLLVLSLSGCFNKNQEVDKGRELVVVNLTEAQKEEEEILNEVLKSIDLVETYKKIKNDLDFTRDGLPSDSIKYEILEGIQICEKSIGMEVDDFILNLYTGIDKEHLGTVKKEFLAGNNSLCKNGLKDKIGYELECEDTLHLKGVNAPLNYLFKITTKNQFIEWLDKISQIQKKEVELSNNEIKLTSGIYTAALIKKLFENKVTNVNECYDLYYTLTE